MRSLTLGMAVAAVIGALGCGQSERDTGAGGNAGQAGSSGGSEVGNAGTSSTGGATSGSSSGGQPVGGSEKGGSDAGSASAGAPPADAGAPSGGGAALVDCDQKKILCKRLAPACAEGEVPSVAGSCYGDCVKIDRCACSDASACPEPDKYTCWSKTHCGPFVQ